MTQAPGPGKLAAESTYAIEHARIRAVYHYYTTDKRAQRRRDLSNPGTRLNAEARWAVLRRSLSDLGLRKHASVLDVGCGAGSDLDRIAAEFAHLRLSLHGIDLLPDRIERARASLPGAVLQAGAAEEMPYRDRQFDVVLASMVFSAILDGRLSHAVAQEMTRVVAEGGAILCYEMRYRAPWSSHTRAVRRRELRQLFGGGTVRATSVTLLPPLARRLGPLADVAYRPLSAVPALRGHYWAEIRADGG
jgi:ubiquinone/menaquinone biosynthesis C-methylase UbiE